MSIIDGVEFSNEKETTKLQLDKRDIIISLYQKLTSKFLVLFIVAGCLVSSLLYQSLIQKNILVNEQLTPAIQVLKQAHALQKANKLIADLLQLNETKNIVELHNKYISLNRDLLQLNSSNKTIFQQWFKGNKSATDIVSRIQDSRTRNQQLRQSGIIQLQLILFSIQPIIEEQLAQNQKLFKQLEAEKIKSRVSYTRASLYAASIQKENDLQQFKILLVNVLASFEALNVQTTLVSIEQLNVQIEQMFVLYKQITNGVTAKNLSDVSQHFSELEKIVLTEKGILAKWQSYIRLVQSYQGDLNVQQQQIEQLLLVPYQYDEKKKTFYVSTFVNALLERYDLELSTDHIITLWILGISLLSFLLFYLLWKIRKQIKISIGECIEIIDSRVNAPEKTKVLDYVEIEEESNLSQSVEPIECYENTIQAEQQLLTENLAEKTERIQILTQVNEQQKIDFSKTMAMQLMEQLQGYQFIERSIIPMMQKHQMACLNHRVVNETNINLAMPLMQLYQKLQQFRVALKMRTETSILRLNDINLIDEVHAILFNKQEEYHNQLFINFDEKLLKTARIDNQLFHYLLCLLIDIVSIDSKSSRLLLQTQLLNKSEGQQLVSFSLTVKEKSITVLPNIIMQLIGIQSIVSITSPLIDAFSLIFTKLHGENVFAQLVDNGYQLSFELPLAIASTETTSNEISLENTHILFLSNNATLARLIENSVISAKGKYTKLTAIDNLDHKLTEEYLSQYKFDLLAVTSDIAVTHLDYIVDNINSLPKSLQPKLMVLQSNTLSYENFGFYAQSEQLFCKDIFLKNMDRLLESDDFSNKLTPAEAFPINKKSANNLPLLLAVSSPQKHQNLQRLLHWFGFQTQVVANKSTQNALWKTGMFSILITEFSESSLVEMLFKPAVNPGVLSLTETLPQLGNDAYFNNWRIAKLNLTEESMLAELSEALVPWLKPSADINKELLSDGSINNNELSLASIEFEDIGITEAVQVFTGNKAEAVFDFSQYLQHQGTAELALFMLEDYTQNNHQQLDTLIDSIKEKNIEQAKLSVSGLTLNANILAAPTLQLVCIKWSKFLSGIEIPSSLDKVNALLKETRIALMEIDKYAEEL